MTNRLLLWIGLVGLMSSMAAEAFSTPSSSSRGATAFRTPAWKPAVSRTSLAASSTEDDVGLFKAGLLANLEAEAAALASKKIRSVKDLGWTGTALRRGNTRPRHWAFGGAGEKAVQDKPNYDPSNPLCVEKWLSLKDFYGILKDDTAIADTIFVALAKGGAYIEREVAEEVIGTWRSGTGRNNFDEAAFLKTVKAGRTDFIIGWAAFVTITGVAVAGIAFPTNPLQLALVDALELITHTDAKTAAMKP